MIKYGIFDGVAQKDHLVAAAVMGLDDYISIYGGTTDDYLDYLLNLEYALEEAEEPCRLVRFHFDREDYQAWLKGSGWIDGPDARSAWALEVAQDERKLAEIKKKWPVLPAAPEDEREVTNVLYSVLPVICASEEDVSRLAKQLSAGKIVKTQENLMKEMPSWPVFRKLSALRASGAALLLGDRLILPSVADEVADYYINAQLELPKGVACVPRRFRIKRAELLNEISGYPILVGCLLPVVAVGGREDVDFLLEWLDESEDAQEVLFDGVTEILKATGWKEDQIGIPGAAFGTLGSAQIY
ncbi:hypothetical protein SDD30_15225 [Moorella naiadis]|uniref:hypothetical protein n=1 Tax=Moorella naiadis (nom. illeg.) TaxID=3093670 RepID=UPI003D9C7DD3